MRDGAASVAIAYRGTAEKLRANPHERTAAIEEGVDIRFLAAPVKILTKGGRMTGVECIFPYETGRDPQAFKALLAKYKLQPAAINVNVKAEPEFRAGGLTSTDPAIRRRAVQFIKDSKDFAQAVGANKVTCCPLGDGYEFAFQCDYAQMWKYLVETFGEAGSYKPEIPLFIEYKPSETRGHCFVDTAAKALCLLNDIGIARMGVTVDYGHSKYGQENPAEVVSLLAASDYPFYVHINDNNGNRMIRTTLVGWFGKIDRHADKRVNRRGHIIIRKQFPLRFGVNFSDQFRVTGHGNLTDEIMTNGEAA